MGNNSSSSLPQTKYNRDFTSKDIQDPTQFDRTEIYNCFPHYKSNIDESLSILDQAIKIIHQKKNMTLRLRSLSDVSIRDDNTIFDINTSYSYPLQKYCVTVDKTKKYCSCDLSIIDLVMTVATLEKYVEVLMTQDLLNN